MSCPESPTPKAAIGCLHCPPTRLCRICPRPAAGSEASLKLPLVGTSTGKSSFASNARFGPKVSKRSLETPRTLNSPAPMPRPSMSGKKKPGFPPRSSSLDKSLLTALLPLIGTPFDDTQLTATLKTYRVMYSYVVITRCERFARTTYDQLQSNELVLSTGGVPALGSHAALGLKQVWKLILKLPQPNSGMATEVKKMLLSMNLEGQSRSLTCSDGWIDIRLSLRLKDPLLCCVQNACGLHQTSIHETGTQA